MGKRIILRLNNREETYLGAIYLPDSVGNETADYLSRNLNALLAEIEGKGHIKDSMFASLVDD